MTVRRSPWPTRRRFGQPTGQKPGLGFPVAHLKLLCDMTTGLVREVIDSPLFTHYLAAGVKCSSMLRRGDLIIADRGFAGWGFFGLHLQQNLHVLVRAHQCLHLSFSARRKDHARGTWTRLYMLEDSGDRMFQAQAPAALDAKQAV